MRGPQPGDTLTAPRQPSCNAVAYAIFVLNERDYRPAGDPRGVTSEETENLPENLCMGA